MTVPLVRTTFEYYGLVTREIHRLQITADSPEDRCVPPPVLLEADVCIHLDDDQRFSWCVLNRLRSELAKPAGRDALRPWVTVLRRHQQPAKLSPCWQG